MISLRRFMSLVVMFSLAACGGSGSGGSSKAQSASDAGNFVQDTRPVQNVFFESRGFAPFVMSDADNRPSGFGIDIVTAIGDKQGFQVMVQTSRLPQFQLPTSVKLSLILPTHTLKHHRV